MPKRLIILVGKAGVGKSALAKPLAQRLKARHIGPDMHPYRWDWAVRQVDATRGNVMLECCQIPRAIRSRMDYQSVVIEVTASDEVRRARLFKQGHDTEEVERRLTRSSPELGWEDRIDPTITVDVSDADPDAVAADVAAQVNSRTTRLTQIHA